MQDPQCPPCLVEVRFAEEVLSRVTVTVCGVEDLLWSTPEAGSLGRPVDPEGGASVLPKTSGIEMFGSN